MDPFNNTGTNEDHILKARMSVVNTYNTELLPRQDKPGGKATWRRK